MEGREISQEFAEQKMQPEIHSFEQLVSKGLSADYATDVVNRDKSIVDLWDEAQEGLKGQ